MWMICIFFFFQAEDGIRDLIVTGVQTCALPISAPDAAIAAQAGAPPRKRLDTTGPRSEERRVGKECRSRWSPDHYKKKKQTRKITIRPRLCRGSGADMPNSQYVL